MSCLYTCGLVCMCTCACVVVRVHACKLCMVGNGIRRAIHIILHVFIYNYIYIYIERERDTHICMCVLSGSCRSGHLSLAVSSAAPAVV